VCYFIWSQWAIVEFNLPTALNALVFSLSNANLTLLDISTCLGLRNMFGESNLILMLWVTRTLFR
jgi:hypothetical protein